MKKIIINKAVLGLSLIIGAVGCNQSGESISKAGGAGSDAQPSSSVAVHQESSIQRSGGESALSENDQLALLLQEVIPLRLEVARLTEVAKHNLKSGKTLRECDDSEVNLNAVEPGFRCTGPEGDVFERVSVEKLSRAWKLPDGSIWSEYLGAEANFGGNYGDRMFATVTPDAEALCTSKGAELPSVSDFQVAYSYGFRDVIPGVKNHKFWTSTSPGFDALTLKELKYFNNAGKDSFDYEPSNLLLGVICVIKAN